MRLRSCCCRPLCRLDRARSALALAASPVRTSAPPPSAPRLPNFDARRPTHAAHWALHGRRRPTAGGAELGARVARRVRVILNLAWFEVARATRPPA